MPPPLMHCAYWPHGLQCEPPGSPKERPGLPNGHPGPCIKEPVSEQVLYGLWGCCGNALLETRGAPKLDPRCPNGDSGSRDACLGFPNGHLGPCIKEPVSEQVLYGLWGCRGRPLMWPSSYLQRVQMRVLYPILCSLLVMPPSPIPDAGWLAGWLAGGLVSPTSKLPGIPIAPQVFP